MRTDNPRGEGWVALQVVATVAVVVVGIFAPRGQRARGPRRVAALALSTLGACAVMMARRDLGNAFSVFPRPRPDASVTDAGVYRVIRHPMYGGVLAQATAIAAWGSPWAILPTGLLAVVLDRKAAHEETMLEHEHPEFADYRERTRWRFLPGIR